MRSDKVNKINIYYFSGTGNTEKIVKVMAEEFSGKGVTVSRHAMEETDPKAIDLAGMLGLAFPVAVLSTYPLVWDFIKALPQGNGCPVFAVDTLGGLPGGTMAHLKSILKQKGYRPVAAKEIQMPLNILYIMSGAQAKEIASAGAIKAKKYARNILNGSAGWPTLPLLPGIVHWFASGLLLLTKIKWHQELFRYKVNKERCTRCGLCIKKCPVGNITADTNGYPLWDLRCQYCMRCISYCPAKAIPAIFNYKKKIYSPQ